MSECHAVAHGKCIYLACKMGKECLRTKGSPPLNWKPMRTPSPLRTKAKS